VTSLQVSARVPDWRPRISSVASNIFDPSAGSKATVATPRPFMSARCAGRARHRWTWINPKAPPDTDYLASGRTDEENLRIARRDVICPQSTLFPSGPGVRHHLAPVSPCPRNARSRRTASRGGGGRSRSAVVDGHLAPTWVHARRRPRCGTDRDPVGGGVERVRVAGLQSGSDVTSPPKRLPPFHCPMPWVTVKASSGWRFRHPG